ncbi:hypothetical protein [Spirosoma sordidisoli]|uniref:Uncharacterized protein n=1 Tax=Spirosoma sordidisoli TaxID=2502893 RepID=A0A4Q2UJJ7_9BACT|nr:hypothetical protein [Spirosoma sordidisoli]RYC69667.1 hypothetical protein EQG79_13785 [Spirosoma sordidisoli]
MNANLFESQLRVILLGPVLTWSSEGDEPVSLVRTNILHTALWKAERDDDGSLITAGQELLMQMLWNSNNDKWRSRQFFRVNNLFAQHNPKDHRVFIRPTRQSGVSTIYVLARFGWEWVGIKANIIQT